MKKRNPPWSRDELLIAFNLYSKLPFGLLHHSNPKIIKTATLIDRSANALAMKLVNLASFDPQLQMRNIKGLNHASKHDKEIFIEFYNNPESLANASEEVLDRLTTKINDSKSEDPIIPHQVKTPTGTTGTETETETIIRARRVQRFFRESVLANYDYKCALTGITITSLINASHIIPWSQNRQRRADPTNGLSLCVLYDRMFDRGLLTFDVNLRVVLSNEIINNGNNTQPPQTKIPQGKSKYRTAANTNSNSNSNSDSDSNSNYIYNHNYQKQLLQNISGQQLKLPHRAIPDPQALAYHRQNIFKN